MSKITGIFLMHTARRNPAPVFHARAPSATPTPRAPRDECRVNVHPPRRGVATGFWRKVERRVSPARWPVRASPLDCYFVVSGCFRKEPEFFARRPVSERLEVEHPVVLEKNARFDPGKIRNQWDHAALAEGV